VPLVQAQLLRQGDQVGVIDPRQVLLVGAAAVADDRVGGAKADLLQHRPKQRAYLVPGLHRSCKSSCLKTFEKSEEGEGWLHPCDKT
jgi:hypothetical protein